MLILFYTVHCTQFVLNMYVFLHNGSHSLLSPLTLSQQPWYPSSLTLVTKLHYLLGHQKIDTRVKKYKKRLTQRNSWEPAAMGGGTNQLCNYFIPLLGQVPPIPRGGFQASGASLPNPEARPALETGVAEATLLFVT